MYGALWRVLPGPTWLRILIMVCFAAAILTALVFWVFPAINELIPTQDVTVDTE